MAEKSRKDFIKKYIPTPALVLFGFAAVSAVIHLISELSGKFSDFFNFYIGSFIRGVLATASGIFPFSVAETVIVMIPVLFCVVLVSCIRITNRSAAGGVRFVTMTAGVLSFLYTLFVSTTTVAYNGTPLANKLGLSAEAVTPNELQATAEYMIDKINEELDSINYSYENGSVMPYSLSEMNRLLLDAYDKTSDKYPFIPRLHSRLKPIALSEPMTYTHISGMFTYYTGEANINTNFPDYSIPFTAAHELAHQRGILPENEANFVAFLVCCESEDPYIRYSGYVNMYEYLNSALYSADYGKFADVYSSLDSRVRGELLSYNRFFEKYRVSAVASISSAVNDTYLRAQGQSEGEKSYGMVVDLAVAYIKAMEKES